MWGLIAGLAGAAAGGISTLISGSKQKAALREQKNNAWQAYLINKDFADTQFALNKGEAQTTLGIQQNRLRQDVNTGVENFNTGLLGQAYGIQDARMNLAGQLGAYDAAQGASGTRGNEASGLVKAYAEKSFDRNLDLQKSQNDQALGGMITGASRGNQDINRERASWEEGGYRSMLFSAEDERNRKLALLGQSGYDSAISASSPGIFDYMMGGLSGASIGLGLYSGIQGAQQFAGGPAAAFDAPTASLQANSFNSIGNGNTFGISPQGFMDRQFGGNGFTPISPIPNWNWGY